MTTYTYTCLVCLREFEHATPNPRLATHMDQRSRVSTPCAGRYGWLAQERTYLAPWATIAGPPAAHRSALPATARY